MPTHQRGHQALIPVQPGQERWLIAVRYVNAYLPRDVYLADLTPATPKETAV